MKKLLVVGIMLLFIGLYQIPIVSAQFSEKTSSIYIQRTYFFGEIKNLTIDEVNDSIKFEGNGLLKIQIRYFGFRYYSEFSISFLGKLTESRFGFTGFKFRGILTNTTIFGCFYIPRFPSTLEYT